MGDVFDLVVPERLDAAASGALARQLDAAERAGARVVVVTGGDRVFCRGLDLEAGLAADAGPAARGFAEVLARLRHLARPTLAVVRGVALGGGLGVAAACDVVLAADDARFGLPEALVGLVPAIIAPLLRERLTPQRLRRLALTGLSVDAAEAQALGLVDAVAPAALLDRERREWVKRLGRAAPAAVARLKAPDEAPLSTLAARLRRGAETTAALLADPETRVSIAAHLAGEVPGSAR